VFDTVGILVLSLLIALFGFVTFRAWRLRRRSLRWVGVSGGGLFTLMLSAGLVLGLIGFYKLNEQHSNPVANIHVAGTTAQIARGQQLAQVCAHCHATNNQLPLSGTNFAAEFGIAWLGTLYAPNLTPSGNIRGWSDGEVMRAIREGIHKDGRSLLVMPSEIFRNLSDEDVQAIVAYLRSQPAIGGPTPTNRFNLLGALFINLADFRTAQSPVGLVTAPEPGTPDYGQYMVDIIGCRGCHGDQLQGRVETGQPGPPAGPNLTQIVPQWTEEEFMTFFNTGQLPGGGTVPNITLSNGLSEPRMPWPEVRAATTDAELKDMYSYLHSLPAVEGPTQ
jgi:cytochrome c553